MNNNKRFSRPYFIRPNLDVLDKDLNQIEVEVRRMYREIQSEYAVAQEIGKMLQALRDITGSIKDYKVNLNLGSGRLHVVYWMNYGRVKNMTFNLWRRG